jgi:hypothetical protein
MNMRSGTILFGIILLCFAVSASAIPIGNIVKNGSFETGGLPPWHTSGTGGTARTTAAASGTIGVDQDSAHTGNFGVFATATGSKVFLSQALQTQKGSSYDLTFWLSTTQTQSDAFKTATATGSPVDFEVFWNGKLILDLDNADNPSSYTKFTLNDLLATSTRTTLKFGFRDAFGEFHLDDVKVGISGVPEAFSTLWLGLPLILLLGARKRILAATDSSTE